MRLHILCLQMFTFYFLSSEHFSLYYHLYTYVCALLLPYCMSLFLSIIQTVNCVTVKIKIWVTGTFAPKNFPGAKVPWYGTFAPGSESSKNFRSQELSFPGTFAPGSESSKNFHSLELSLPGTFAPGSESSKNFRSLELSFPGTFAPWLSNN